MKKTFIIISCAALAVACGNGSGTKTSDTKDSAASTVTAPTTVSPEAEKALELIGSSDCQTCHKINKEDTKGGPTGPIYTDVAAKYAPAADSTVDRIVKKIVTGGSGVWGAVPMTPHPALKEADIKTIVTYILTLKK